MQNLLTKDVLKQILQEYQKAQQANRPVAYLCLGSETFKSLWNDDDDGLNFIENIKVFVKEFIIDTDNKFFKPDEDPAHELHSNVLFAAVDNDYYDLKHEQEFLQKSVEVRIEFIKYLINKIQ